MDYRLGRGIYPRSGGLQDLGSNINQVQVKAAIRVERGNLLPWLPFNGWNHSEPGIGKNQIANVPRHARLELQLDFEQFSFAPGVHTFSGESLNT
jgi:hypothetical protein